MGQHIRYNGTKHSLSIFFQTEISNFLKQDKQISMSYGKIRSNKMSLDNFVIANHAVELRQFC